MKKAKRLLSAVLAVVMVLSIVTILSFSAAASTNGHSQGEAVAWVNSQVNTTHGNGQCVFFVRDYYAYLGQTMPTGNANQYVNGGVYCPSGWSYQSSPQPGDIAVWTSGQYGHVAVVTEIRGSQMVCVESNYLDRTYVSANLHSIDATKYIRPDFSIPEPTPVVSALIYHGAEDYSNFRPVIKFSNPETVASVVFALKYEGGDWHWYNGEFNGDNAWYCDVISSDLGSGEEIVCHCYVTGKNGSYIGYAFSPDPVLGELLYHGSTNNSDFRPVIRIQNPDSVSEVKFAVKYEGGEWHWYDGQFNGDNAWYCDVLSSDLGSGKIIICHCYVSGKNGHIKGCIFPELTLGKDSDPIVDLLNFDGATDRSDFRPVIRIQNPDSVSEVKFAVKYEGGEWHWYDGQFNGDNAWYCDVLSSDLGEGTTIICHGYIYANNGSRIGYTFPEKITGDTEPPTTPTEQPTEPSSSETQPTEPSSSETQPTNPSTSESQPTNPSTSESQSTNSSTSEAQQTESGKTDISNWTVEGLEDTVYTGKVIKPEFDVVSDDGEYAEFAVNYKNNKNVGIATVTITGTGDYTGTIVKTFKITKAANPVKITAKKIVTAKAKKKTIIKKAVVVKKAQGKVTYKTNNKKITVKKGTMTVAKGLKKGKPHSVKVTITAKGNSNYKSAKKTVTIKVKIK